MAGDFVRTAFTAGENRLRVPVSFHPDYITAYRINATQHSLDFINFQAKITQIRNKQTRQSATDIIRNPHFNATPRCEPCATPPIRQSRTHTDKITRTLIHKGFQFDSSHNQKISNEIGIVATFVIFLIIDHPSGH
ncbi:hypothetical protein [Burkholderia sp. JP2-270]|uniref:hypothetical protein n=1 Tax=Burkholderia sp. JP2-270 TaxID=2217913 RepID=UPI0013A6B0D0|nr:hypothetical protein [Burkholderia sp. JP2-270]